MIMDMKETYLLMHCFSSFLPQHLTLETTSDVFTKLVSIPDALLP